jgi:hypothetical protein
MNAMLSRLICRMVGLKCGSATLFRPRSFGIELFLG